MENMQSEILFIAKFGGIVFTAFTHYFYVIKPIAIFNERQKANKKDIEKLKIDLEHGLKELTILKTEHDKNEKDGNHCKSKKVKR
jgi:hypothetical protein